MVCSSLCLETAETCTPFSNRIAWRWSGLTALCPSRIAPRFPDVAFLCLNVVKGAANKAAAMEKVCTAPEARRRGAPPVLRDYRRWPCFTLHQVPRGPQPGPNRIQPSICN